MVDNGPETPDRPDDAGGHDFETTRQPDGRFGVGNPGGNGRPRGQTDGVVHLRRKIGEVAQRLVDSGRVGDFFAVLQDVPPIVTLKDGGTRPATPEEHAALQRKATKWMLDFMHPYLMRVGLEELPAEHIIVGIGADRTIGPPPGTDPVPTPEGENDADGETSPT